MDICDPEILKAEKFGSRDGELIEFVVCCVCGASLPWEDALYDVVGNGFCSNECREKKFMDGRCVKRNDKKGAYADLLSES